MKHMTVIHAKDWLVVNLGEERWEGKVMFHYGEIQCFNIIMSYLLSWVVATQVLICINFYNWFVSNGMPAISSTYCEIYLLGNLLGQFSSTLVRDWGLPFRPQPPHRVIQSPALFGGEESAGNMPISLNGKSENIEMSMF